jgi:hypothetical protein
MPPIVTEVTFPPKGRNSEVIACAASVFTLIYAETANKTNTAPAMYFMF